MGDHSGGAGRSSYYETVRVADQDWLHFRFQQEAENYMDRLYAAPVQALPKAIAGAVAVYANTRDFRGVNGILRGNDIEYWQANRAAYQSLLDEMDQAFTLTKTRLRKNMVVYRMVDGDYNRELRALPIGATVTDLGFMSTTVRHTFNGYRILVPKGTRALWAKPLSRQRDESELILQRGTTLRIVDKDRRGDPVFMVVGQK